MRTSTNLKFQIPELDDQANITVIGSALDALDNAVGDSLAMSGDASNAQVTFERATARENISSKDTLTTLMSKVSRWFADLKDAAFHSVANNLTTTASGYVLDARQGKALNDAVGKTTTQLGGFYFGTMDNGKPGYKTSANGSYNPFRNPTGTATAGDVLVGKTFANASSDSINGTMPNNGDVSKTLTPTDGGDVTATIPAGYTSGGTITAKGGTAYNNGYASGYSVGKESCIVKQWTQTFPGGAGSRGYDYNCAVDGYTLIAAGLTTAPVSGGDGGNPGGTYEVSHSGNTVHVGLGANNEQGAHQIVIECAYRKN